MFWIICLFSAKSIVCLSFSYLLLRFDCGKSSNFYFLSRTFLMFVIFFFLSVFSLISAYHHGGDSITNGSCLSWVHRSKGACDGEFMVAVLLVFLYFCYSLGVIVSCIAGIGWISDGYYTKLHFWPLKFGMVFILVLSVWDFSFWFTKFDSIFKMVIPSISVTNLAAKRERERTLSFCWNLTARSIMEINRRTILKTESDLVDQNENLKFKRPKWKQARNLGVKSVI